MRVVLVGTGVEPIPPSGYGGVERTIAELQRALQSAGEEVTVLHQAVGGRLGEYRFALGLLGLLRAVPHDVVHASTPVVANRLALAGIPFVYTSHSRHWFLVRGPTQRWGRWLERRAVRDATIAIALTDRVRGRMEAMVPSRRRAELRVVPIGVDPTQFRPGTALGDPTVALGVGAVIPAKRWELAGRALAGTRVRLRIVGPVVDSEYGRTVVASGPVELLGEMDSEGLTREYQASGFLLHPSAVELLSGVVLQAMASGLPVVGADPIAPVIDEGVTGFVAPPTATSDEIVDHLRRWSERLSSDESLRRSVGSAARRAVEERFGWRPVAEAHRAIYRQAVALGATRARSRRP